MAKPEHIKILEIERLADQGTLKSGIACKLRVSRKTVLKYYPNEGS
jgi:hypothetical protein